MINLSAAGLSPTEAKVYTKLLESSEWLPSKLALIVNETRTNVYKILDKLISLNLATKSDSGGKLRFSATNPAHLLELARTLREQRQQAEEDLEVQTSQLMRQYIKTNEQPGVRFFQGKKQIALIFDELSRSREEIKFINTKAGIDFYGFEYMQTMRMKAVKSEVKRRSLTLDTNLVNSDYRQTDAATYLTRTWLQANDYTAPVEWGVFENKLYLISYGKEALGIIIESPQIADSFKQLFTLLERGQKLLPNYEDLPRNTNSPKNNLPS